MKTAIPDNGYRQILLAVTITTLLCALSLSIPILGFFCFLILPLPAIYYRIRLGKKTAAIVSLTSLILLTAFTGDLSLDVYFLAGMMMLGFFLGEFIEKDLVIEKTVGYACGIVLLAGMFALLLYGNLSNLGLTEVVSGYISKNIELTIILYEKMGMPEENIRLLSESMDQISYVLMRIIPALVASGLLLSACLNLLLTRITLKSEREAYTALGPLNKWKAPDFLVWGVIVISLMLLVPNSSLKIIGLNGMILFTMIYFFQGMAIITFYFEKKQLPIVLRVLLYGIIFIQQLLVLAIAGLGFFDVWLNFRKIGKNNNKQLPLSS